MSRQSSQQLSRLANYFKYFPIQTFQVLKLHKKKAFSALVICIGLAAISAVQNYLVYMPVAMLPKSPQKNPRGYRDPSQRGLNYENVEVITEDKLTLKGWHVKVDKPKRLIVFFHENADNIGGRMDFLKEITSRTNSDVLLIAYRGFSDSEGTPSEKGIKKDCVAILDEALKRVRDRSQVPMYVYGRSLGGAVSAYAASLPQFSNKIKGLILQNTFTSIPAVVYNIFRGVFSIFRPIIWLLNRNYWNSLSVMPHVKGPILFIKSVNDELIPKSQMDQLQAEAEKHHIHTWEYQILKGTHNTSWSVDPDSYFQNMNRFFKQVETVVKRQR